VRTLVTGGAGFIGSHLVDALVERGDDVVVLDNLATGRADNVTRLAKFVEGDVSQPDDVAEAIAGCETVFHQAALGSVPRSVARPLDTDRANVHGTLTVLAAAKDASVQRVVLASSSSVYGGASQVPTPEYLELVPRSPYAVSKLTGEHYARVAWELHGLETVCLRYFNVFGPRQRPDSEYAAVIPRFIDALLNGLPPEVHGDGLQARDFTFVSDAVQANLRAAEAPPEQCAGKAYNVAHGSPHSLLELLAVLKTELGTDLEPVHVGSRPGDVRLSHADVSAAERDLGYVPVVSFEEGLVKTLDWFRSQKRELLGS
jgi:UDP-glucose 4-epimerase